jgi:hypothetical protein
MPPGRSTSCVVDYGARDVLLFVDPGGKVTPVHASVTGCWIASSTLGNRWTVRRIPEAAVLALRALGGDVRARVCPSKLWCGA